MKWAGDGSAADGFDGGEYAPTAVVEALDLAPVLISNLSGGILRSRDLVAEAGGPHRERNDVGALHLDRGLHTDHIAVVEVKALVDDEIAVGIIEGEVGGRG